LQSKLSELQTFLDTQDLTIGATANLGTEDFVNGLNALIEKTGMTTGQV
jgi:hypothetical protein